jgi:hypothetical protein
MTLNSGAGNGAKLVADFGTLLRLAREESRARASGDPARLAEAEKAHAAYRQLCLQADEMSVGQRGGLVP